MPMFSRCPALYVRMVARGFVCYCWALRKKAGQESSWAMRGWQTGADGPTAFSETLAILGWTGGVAFDHNEPTKLCAGSTRPTSCLRVSQRSDINPGGVLWVPLAVEPLEVGPCKAGRPRPCDSSPTITSNSQSCPETVARVAVRLLAFPILFCSLPSVAR